MPGKKSFDRFTEEYFTARPEEIDDYLVEILDAYAKNADSAALLSQLRTIARVKGISVIADEIGMSRKGLQKALSEGGNPRLENINAIMRAMGYQLTPQRIAEPPIDGVHPGV
jgi:probable addiction module antidote protein